MYGTCEKSSDALGNFELLPEPNMFVLYVADYIHVLAAKRSIQRQQLLSYNPPEGNGAQEHILTRAQLRLTWAQGCMGLCVATPLRMMYAVAEDKEIK